MLQKLNDLFSDKMVRVTHTSSELRNYEGRCKRVFPVPGQNDHFNLELMSGTILGFVPEIVTDQYADGPLRAACGGRRKIELIPETDGPSGV